MHKILNRENSMLKSLCLLFEQTVGSSWGDGLLLLSWGEDRVTSWTSGQFVAGPKRKETNRSHSYTIQSYEQFRVPHLPHMHVFFACGKPENPERTHRDTWRHANSMQRPLTSNHDLLPVRQQCVASLCTVTLCSTKICFVSVSPLIITISRSPFSTPTKWVNK